MSNEILLSNNQHLPEHLRHRVERARERIKNARSENTRKSYESDWKQFVKWCQENNLPYLPSDPAVVLLYIDYLVEKKRKVSTILRHLSSISQNHEDRGFNSPTKDVNVRLTIDSIKKELGTRPTQKKAATANIIMQICDHLPDTLKGLRDRAILLVGMSGALRRSEIAALNVEDIEFHDEGMTIFLPKSKTDQTGEGYLIGIEFGEYPYCPVRILQAWLREANITTGAVFRRINKAGRVLDRLTDKSIAKIIKDAAARAGFDKSEFSGHSLRRGFITTAKRAGWDEFDIMSHTRHESVITMRRYIDKSDVFKNNPTRGIWKKTT